MIFGIPIYKYAKMLGNDNVRGLANRQNRLILTIKPVLQRRFLKISPIFCAVLLKSHVAARPSNFNQMPTQNNPPRHEIITTGRNIVYLTCGG